MVMFNKFDNSQKKIVYKDEEGEDINVMSEALSNIKDTFVEENNNVIDVVNYIDEKEDEVLDKEEEPVKQENKNTAMLTLEDMLSSYYHMPNDYQEDDDIEYDEEEYEDFDLNDDDDDIEEESNKNKERIIYIPKTKKELTPYERLMIKTKPGKYRLGIDPQIRFKLQEKQREEKRKKKLKKLEGLTPEQVEKYYAEKKAKKERKKVEKFMKLALEGMDPKYSKKKKKTEEKIKKAYYKQMRSQRQQFKTLDDLIFNYRYEAYLDQIGYNYFYGNKRRPIDPYKRYRKHGNIITVSEAENFEKDFKTSFMKNLELELMNKINEPVTLGGKTVVEYYDKKGRLKQRQLLEDKMSKKKKKKIKKQENKLKNKMISPNYHKLY